MATAVWEGKLKVKSSFLLSAISVKTMGKSLASKCDVMDSGKVMFSFQYENYCQGQLCRIEFIIIK